jgi:hypothetical protein
MFIYSSDESYFKLREERRRRRRDCVQVCNFSANKVEKFSRDSAPNQIIIRIECYKALISSLHISN